MKMTYWKRKEMVVFPAKNKEWKKEEIRRIMSYKSK